MKLNVKFSHLAIVLLSTATLWSCAKEEITTNNSSDDTNEIVVAIIDEALSSSTSGLMYEAEQSAQLAAAYMVKSGPDNSCNTTFDSTIVYPYGFGNLNGTYTGAWSWTINCNNFFLPTSINLASSSSNTYTTNALRSTASGSSDWLIDNLLTGDQFVFAGSYQREGMFSIQLKELHTWSSDFSFDLEGLFFDKVSLEPENGKATFDFNGMTAQGEKIEVEGSIEFTGKDKAIITINGKTYEIDLK